jgi:C-terminal processing protease CtpA/Prc
VTHLPFLSLKAENLTDTQVERALEAIWLRTPTPEKRSPDSAKRAALEAYLTRLGPGTAIVTETDLSAGETPFAPSQFHSEVIVPSVGYIRLGAFLDTLPERLEPALRDFEQIGVRSVILDLRATSARGNLSLANEVASYFLPEGTAAFQIQSASRSKETLRTKKNPFSLFRIVLLTGDRTAGPVEAFAGALRAHGGALIIGVSTQGQAADFELVPIGDDSFLRLSVREAFVSGAPQLVPDGLHPDIICNSTPAETDAVLLKETQEGRVANLLKQTERPRLNEASLVANKNPETEAWIQTQLNRKQNKPEPLPKDAALTMAMDFLAGWEALYGRTNVLP